MNQHYDGDYSYSTSNRNNIVSSLWAIVAIGALVLLAFLLGLGAVLLFGDGDWVAIYLVSSGVILVVVLVYFGIYALMGLLANFGLGIARSQADVLHAASQSGAQQARAITEVIRGANQINKADADTQQKMIESWNKIGATYEMQLAKMAARLALAESQAPQLTDKAAPFFVVDDDDDNEIDGGPVTYKMPKVQ
jgi:hypothetical protein